MRPAKYVGWLSGYHSKIDAEVAFSELDRIRQEHDGDLTTELVVEEARPKKSPLHPQIFDLPQRAAAEEYFKANARRMIRSVIVRYEEAEEVDQVRAFVVVGNKPPAKRGSRSQKFYGSTEAALQNPERREYVLAQALRDAATWRRKYAALSELAQIFIAIDDTASAVL